jgi:hypothetical protein
MEALSRREESDLLEKGKKEAMKHCEDIVKGEFSIVNREVVRISDCQINVNRLRRLCCWTDILGDFRVQRQAERHEIVHEGLVSSGLGEPGIYI